jgi:HlyD family secretion protein
MTTSRHRFAAVAFALAAFGSAACARRAEPDAYGNVEATEVVVGAESAGRLIRADVTEGQLLAAGAVVGAIDSTQLAFERDQLVAQRSAAASRIDEVRRQLSTLDAQRGGAAAQRAAAQAQRRALATQLEIARRAYERTQRLVAGEAATAQQLDQTERDYRVLEDQIKAQDEQIQAYEHQVAAVSAQMLAARAQEQTAREQAAAAEAQVGQAGERIRKTDVRNPVAGTVLTTYAKAGENVQIGQPLYRIADLKAVDIRAYVTETQLASIRIGQQVSVTFDAGRGERRSVSGPITWIAAQAEFTPTPIQTREERADMVYAIKIRVPNDGGLLKIGMPADVQFVDRQARR